MYVDATRGSDDQHKMEDFSMLQKYQKEFNITQGTEKFNIIITNRNNSSMKMSPVSGQGSSDQQLRMDFQSEPAMMYQSIHDGDSLNSSLLLNENPTDMSIKVGHFGFEDKFKTHSILNDFKNTQIVSISRADKTRKEEKALHQGPMLHKKTVNLPKYIRKGLSPTTNPAYKNKAFQGIKRQRPQHNKYMSIKMLKNENDKPGPFIGSHLNQVDSDLVTDMA